MSGDQDGPGSDGPGEPVGSVAEEAAKLLGALSGWAQDAVHGVDEHVATGAPECAYCPICRTVHVLRQTSPEVRTQLTTAASALLQAAAGLLEAAGADPGTGRHGGTRARRAGVEHIDLHDTGDWPGETDPEEGDE